MKLERRLFEVEDVRFGERTALEGNVLYLNRAELEAELARLPAVRAARVELVHPGEQARIVHVLDSILPMVKVSGPGTAYPGHLSDPVLVGEGVTHVLANVAVMESALVPTRATGLLRPRDAIVDMVGPAAGMHPFSNTHNVVLCLELEEGKSDPEYDAVVRQAGLRVADVVARATLGAEPVRTEVYDLEAAMRPGLPRVAYVYQVQNQGTFSNTLLYGRSVDNLVPTLLHPQEVLDGALVSGNYVWPLFKIPTFLHCTCPVMMELLRGHGREHNFVGMVLSRGHNYTHFEKQRSANLAAKLVRWLGADGVVVTWEGGGNSATDAMLTIQACEKMGIKAVSISYEFGGPDGTEGILLVDDVPEADALVSAGSIEKPMVLPAVQRVVGGDLLYLSQETGAQPVPAAGELRFEQPLFLYCAGNQTGYSRLAAVAY